jgi:hypothetical protein
MTDKQEQDTAGVRVKPLTKTQIEILANNIHNTDDYHYTVECLSYHLTVPEGASGFRLMPHEPTGGMLDAAMKADQDGGSASMKTIWMAMWSAFASTTS